MAFPYTIIRDSKGKGGTVGITRNMLALLRWTPTHHVTGDYAAAMNEFCAGESSDGKIHGECHTAAMKRDDDQVQTLRSHIKNSMTNPFYISSHPEVLINISKGLHAPTQLQTSLPGISEKGLHILEQFLEYLFDVDEKSFHSTMTKSGTITFGDIEERQNLLA